MKKKTLKQEKGNSGSIFLMMIDFAILFQGEEETPYPFDFYVHNGIMLKPYFLISPVVRQHNFYDHFGKCWSCQGP